MKFKTEFECAVKFIEHLGIKISFTPITEDCFLPGILIENGGITVDMDKLKYPGDILHEAGHIAVVPEADRDTLSAGSIAERKDREAEEMMSIAWSYAACKYLDLDPYFVFHPEGYRGGADHLVQTFESGAYLALPMLQWTGLALEEKRAKETGKLPYPVMQRWLRS
jgi:hypothetical protein